MSRCCLYTWGANSHGQLGLGFKSEMCTRPCQVDLTPIELDCGGIIKISGGAGHTLILDKHGRIYSCGWNNRGQAGIGLDANEEILHFHQINSLENERITDITCGWDSSMALTSNGHIYVWGSNVYGQLGRKDCPNSTLKEPRRNTDLNDRIKAISMGLRHSAIVTETGKVLVTGSGNKGQLGMVDNENQRIRSIQRFSQVPGLEDVVDVGCGQNHTVALTKTGDIYSWGDNKHGQLGIDNTKVKGSDTPRRINMVKTGRSCKLRVGWTHTSILSDDGRITTWGRNEYGQLGYRKDDKNMTSIPKTILGFERFSQLSVGSEHNVAVTDDAQLVTWGWNEHGNCGDGSTQDVLTPSTVFIPGDGTAILVGSGAGHSFAITRHN